jgi:hypothetical protein
MDSVRIQQAGQPYSFNNEQSFPERSFAALGPSSEEDDMKTRHAVAISMLIVPMVVPMVVFLFSLNVLAGGFLEMQYEHVTLDEGDSFIATDNYFAYYRGPWDVGFEALTGNNGFWDVRVHCRHKVFDGLFLGPKILVNNEDERRLALSLAYDLDLERIFTGLDKGKHSLSFTYNQELFRPNRLTDLWARYTLLFGYLHVSAEAGYYFHGVGPEHFYIRPIRLGYPISEKVMPYMMLQRSWVHDDGWRRESDSIFFGIDVIW